MRFRIQTQINALLLGILAFGIVSTVGLTTALFSTDLMGLMRRTTFELSLSVSHRIQNELKSAADLARLLAAASFEEYRYPEDRLRLMQETLSGSPHVHTMTLFELRNSEWSIRWRLGNSASTLESLNDFDRMTTEQLKLSTRPKFFRGATSTGINLIRLVVPILKQSNGRFSHCMAIDIPETHMLGALTATHGSKHFLINESSQIILTNDRALGLSLDAMKSPKEGETKDVVDIQGRTYFAAYQHFSISDATLSVLSLVPEATIWNKVIRVIRRAGWLTGFFLCLSFVFGMTVAMRMSRPIKALAQAAKRVQKGDFTVRTPEPKETSASGPSSSNEIDQLSQVFDEMVLGLQERDRVKATFAKFHSQEVAEKLMRGEIHLGGERREAVVFFSDIRGFTAMSEELPPETIVTLLNRYLTTMVHIIHSHGGVVDKYVGDAIMAVWGVPSSGPHDAHSALLACIDMRRSLAKLNRQLAAENLPILNIGMALNAGPLVAGNIGSEERMEYTVIGDTVNTASRIESLTKEVGVDLLVSEALVQALGEKSKEFQFEQIQSMPVKGKRSLLTLYKVVSDSTSESI